MRIIRTSLFERSLKKLGASAADLAKLEADIAANPTIGDVIQGLGGARKVRFSMAGRGKSGGRRVHRALGSDRRRGARDCVCASAAMRRFAWHVA